MPQFKKLQENLNRAWDILKVLSVAFLIFSTITSTIVWIAVNVFCPGSIAIEILKYILLILIPSTGSAIMLQVYRKRVDKEIRTLKEEIPKIEQLSNQTKGLAEVIQQLQKNLQYFNNIFAVQCLNPNCREWISIPIPASLVKDIHLVDGRPTGKLGGLAGREMQVRCLHCEQVYHIVYP